MTPSTRLARTFGCTAKRTGNELVITSDITDTSTILDYDRYCDQADSIYGSYVTEAIRKLHGDWTLERIFYDLGCTVGEDGFVSPTMCAGACNGAVTFVNFDEQCSFLRVHMMWGDSVGKLWLFPLSKVRTQLHVLKQWMWGEA